MCPLSQHIPLYVLSASSGHKLKLKLLIDLLQFGCAVSYHLFQMLSVLLHLLFRPPEFSMFFNFEQCPIYGGGKSRQTVFKDIIRRAFLDCFYCKVFPYGPGKKDKRYSWTLSLSYV